VAVKSQPDIRWERCDIKTVALLPNVLAKQAARESGAYEAWLIDDKGCVTEGASTNAWIVTRTTSWSPARPTTASWPASRAAR
jgi:D-alanine transaminase